jgi:hypothetical protein
VTTEQGGKTHLLLVEQAFVGPLSLTWHIDYNVMLTFIYNIAIIHMKELEIKKLMRNDVLDIKVIATCTVGGQHATFLKM